VTSSEFNSFIKGLYIIPSTWTKTGTIAASATPGSITGTHVGPFDTTYKFVLNFLFDGVNSVLVELPKGQIDLATTVSFLNAHTVFNKLGIASDSTGFLRITSRCLGTNSSVAMLAEERSAVASFYLSTPTIVSPTGTVATVNIPTINPTGMGIQSIQHSIKIYTTNFGTSTVNTELKIQRITKGTLVSGLGTTEVVINSGNTGEITFEVAAPGAITLEGWAQVVLPSNHYFAQIPTDRLRVV
jgi:hypothetical protein